MPRLRFVWRIITEPFRLVWHLLHLETSARWGLGLIARLERHAGVRVGLLPAAILFGLMLLLLLALPPTGSPWEPIRPIFAVLIALMLLYVIGLYLGYVIRGEGGPPQRTTTTRAFGVSDRRSSALSSLLDRFGSNAARLARARR